MNGASGTKSITRQVFGTPDNTAVASYADLWWVPSESGWGLSINQQYRTLFVVWYAYDASGSPVWYVMPGGSWNGNAYGGTLYRTAHAPRPFFGGQFDASTVSRTPVGSLTLRFSGTTSATMSYVVNGVAGEKVISRQPF